ncbi:MAG: hypothetical protein IK055_08065 [Lachnospiraceae bacterium]|nr:hypothetical protein [Lachnospiraceae bacterium]
MRRVKKIEFLVLAFLLVLICCIRKASAVTTYPNGIAWYMANQRNLPDYYCGSWIIPDRGGTLVISIISMDKSEEILSQIEDKESVRFVEGKHTYKQLQTISLEITDKEQLEASKTIVFIGISDCNNCVHVGLSSELSQEEADIVAANLEAEYGKCFSFAYGVDPIYINEKSKNSLSKSYAIEGKGVVLLKDSSLRALNKEHGVWYRGWSTIQIAGILAGIIVVFMLLFGLHVRKIANNGEYVRKKILARKDIEEMIHQSDFFVSIASKNRIFKDINELYNEQIRGD